MLERLKQVPFVNGGLFDCLDQVFRNVENRSNVRLDDFSEELGNRLCLPNELFFGEDRDIDLSQVYDDKFRKKEKVQGIIAILSRYKFTIEENTPLEQEIALDPELLGKVFENLLASYNEDTRTTARKATGSFYTPREIVNYMVDEALIAWLEASLVKSGIALSAAAEGVSLNVRLHRLFAASAGELRNPFAPAETEVLIAAIDRVKILDPACGSGAFPMGALHRLVDLLGKLDPNNRRWKAQQLERARQDRQLAEQMQIVLKSLITSSTSSTASSMNSSSPHELQAQKLTLFKHVEDASLPAIDSIPENQRLAVIQETFERLNELNHPVKDCLCSLGSLESVHIIVGSFVQGRQNPQSDIDILVEFEMGKKTFDNFMHLAFFLEEILGRHVDLVTPESLSPYIGPHILREVEYGSNGA